MNNKILEGKNIIIIGASTGIGKALSFGLAELGAKVGLVSRSKDKLEQNVNKIKEMGCFATFYVADTSKYDQIKASIDFFASELNEIHVLINNAAIASLETNIPSVELIDKVIDINLKGTLYSTLAILPYFKKIKMGSIINTSSVAGLFNWDGASPLYDITKAGINRFTTTRNSDFEMNKIRINSILPGWVMTPMIEHIPNNVLKSMVEGTGVPIMKPEELIPYYVFFASDFSKRETKKLVNVVSFMRAFKFIEQLPKDIPRKFENLKELLQKNVSYGTFSNVSENKKLFDFILNYNEIIGEKDNKT